MAATATKVNLKPLADRVVIEIREEDISQQTSGGIYLPETAREKPQKGVVVAVGPGKTLDNGQKEPMSLKPGDIVLFQKYGGTDIRLDDKKEYKILAERDILAIVE